MSEGRRCIESFSFHIFASIAKSFVIVMGSMEDQMLVAVIRCMINFSVRKALQYMDLATDCVKSHIHLILMARIGISQNFIIFEV